MTHFGIVIFPKKPIQDCIDSYRKRYDPHYKLIAPHITLKEKFKLNEHNLDDLIANLKTVAKNTSEFIIQLNKISHFHPTSNTIYLAINNSKPLINLHNELQKYFEQKTAPYDFIPHLTIGQKMSEEELHDIYSSLRMSTFEFENKVDCFYLLQQLENESWNVHQSFELAK